jgi:hypothetical protein
MSISSGSLSCTTPSQSSAITGTTTVCSGSAQTYSVTNVSGTGYTWSLPDGSWSGSSTSNSITANVGSAGGTISVTPYNAASGCSNYTASSQSISVSVNATPSAPSASAQSFCSSASPTVADLTVTSGSSIKWYDASTNGNLVASETALTSANYYASQTVSSCESATRSSVAVTVNANGTWIGDSNDDWNNANNWCGGIPNSNSIVVSIPSGVTVNLDTSPSVSELTIASTSVINAGSNTVTIANGGTFSNNGTFNAQTGTVAFSGTGTLAGNATTFNNLTTNGNLTASASPTINGTLTLTSGTLTVGANTLTVNGSISTTSGNIDASNASATVVFGGSTAQTVPASAFTGNINNLTLNNSAGLSISQDLSVVGALALTSGKLTIGANHLTLGLDATIGGAPSASNMIIASGDGELRKRFAQGSGDIAAFTFPVGNSGGVSEYTPIVLDFASGSYGANAYVGVRVQDRKQATLNSSVTNYLNRNWIVEPNDITGFNYKIQLHYVDADFVTDGSMAEGDLKPIKISSGQWYQPTDGSFTNAVSQGSAGVFANSNYLEWNGLTTFSEFGGAGGSNQPLPVELLSFTAECANESILLKWQTASEFNSSHFDVEKSTDGLNWSTIGLLPAAGNSNELLSYSFEDASKIANTSYYRINQVDIDGLQKYYGPINPLCESINHLNGKTIPNPSNNEFWLQISSNEEQKFTYVLQDVNGSKIMENSAELLPGSNMFPIRETIPSGMYFIIIQTDKGKHQVIKHIIN